MPLEIVYVGAYGAVVTAAGSEFANGEPVEVSESVGASLLERADFVAAETAGKGGN